MKIYILTDEDNDECCSYQYISSAFLVPDDFDEDKEWAEILERAKNSPNIRKTFKGQVYENDWNKVHKLRFQYFKEKFQELKFKSSTSGYLIDLDKG